MAEKSVKEDDVKELIKCDADGHTDWKTLGNIITTSLLEEVFHASFVDRKHGRVSKENSQRPATQWRFDYQEEDVLIFKKPPQKQQNNGLSFMGRGIIDLPLQEVADILFEAESFRDWNKFMTESTIVRIMSESDKHRDLVGYFCHENTRCFIHTKRDFVLFIHSEYIDGKFVQAGISVEHPECPVVEGITRAEACLGSGWVLEPYGDGGMKTLASYAMNLDLHAPFPPVIMNRFLRRQPLTLHYMRAHVIKLKQTRSKSGGSPAVAKKTRVTEGEEEEHDIVSKAAIEATIGSSSNSHSFLCETGDRYEESVGIDDFTGT